ncbi:DUF1987 domain-containing protein [Williamwhitmania taraxaci]|uniref:SiaC family regulatory phosphoprotein domain-containing protein n=1 Tax=Williamwhitmania taraxaci TaxID=1640674 RepID=A0A1G6KHW5_9BACT|nr:DUF1987 domain-containing protein [Williamwhitmania taraxaci]SDC30620.1 protein of unknown function [Williamwhitmania taraxaci]
MEIILDKTTDTPLVHFAPGLLIIEGRSITEDVFGFWTPLLNWVESYAANPETTTRVEIGLEYTSSSSNKLISQILRKITSIAAKGFDIEVIWKYEEDDESILQLGRDMESICEVPFQYLETDTVKQRSQKITIRRKKNGEQFSITQRYWEAIVRNGHDQEYSIISKEE